MAVIAGQRTTANVLASQREIDLHRAILLLEPDAAPFTVITKNVFKQGMRRPAIDPLFSWHNDELESRFDAVNNGAGYAAGDVSVVVDTGDLFAAEDVVRVPRTGESISVTSISTNTLTVVRGIGGTTAAALVDNDPLYILGTAAEEGDTSQAARTNNPVKVDNYTQIFKHTVNASGTWLSSSNKSSPHDWPYQIKKQGIEHLKDIELAMLFGAPGTSTGADGGPRRFTGGVLNYANQNAMDAGGALTEAEFETFIRTAFRYGTKNKTLFSSRLLTSVLNTFSSNKLNTFVGAESYGVRVGEWISAHGKVNIVTHDLLEGATYGGYGILVDFKTGEVQYKYLNGDGPGSSRDTKVLPNRQAPDRDGRVDEWLTEAGLQIGLPKSHGTLTGVTG